MVGSAALFSRGNPVVYRIPSERKVAHANSGFFCASPRVPKYRRHKPTGQAVVTLNGKDHYLGRWNSKASRAAYERLVGEWLASGRTLRADDGGLSVAELCRAYLAFAQGYYRKDGKVTGTVHSIRVAVRELRTTYGLVSVRDFGPLSLQALQRRLAESDHSRVYVNCLIDIVRRMFKWGVAQEMVAETIYRALTTVPGLRMGRTVAREKQPIRAVAEAVIEKTMAHLSPTVADMIRFQRLTGCRPGEVCQLRPMDLDRTGEIWIYRPASHKTEHHGRDRVIFIGPKAQDVLRPYLLRPADQCCFSAVESAQQRMDSRHAARKTPLSCGNRPGTNRKSRPKRRPTGEFNKDAYNRAVQRACEAAFGMPKELRWIPTKLPKEETQQEVFKAEQERLRKLASAWRAEHCWSPNQLRHSAATEIRRRFGLEAAQVILGHAKADVTQVYAERDMTTAAEVMRKIG